LLGSISPFLLLLAIPFLDCAGLFLAAVCILRESEGSYRPLSPVGFPPPFSFSSVPFLGAFSGLSYRFPGSVQVMLMVYMDRNNDSSAAFLIPPHLDNFLPSPFRTGLFLQTLSADERATPSALLVVSSHSTQDSLSFFPEWLNTPRLADAILFYVLSDFLIVALRNFFFFVSAACSSSPLRGPHRLPETLPVSSP